MGRCVDLRCVGSQRESNTIAEGRLSGTCGGRAFFPQPAPAKVAATTASWLLGRQFPWLAETFAPRQRLPARGVHALVRSRVRKSAVFRACALHHTADIVDVDGLAGGPALFFEGALKERRVSGPSVLPCRPIVSFLTTDTPVPSICTYRIGTSSPITTAERISVSVASRSRRPDLRRPLKMTRNNWSTSRATSWRMASFFFLWRGDRQARRSWLAQAMISAPCSRWWNPWTGSARRRPHCPSRCERIHQICRQKRRPPGPARHPSPASITPWCIRVT
jgi:hypothetical protein